MQQYLSEPAPTGASNSVPVIKVRDAGNLLPIKAWNDNSYRRTRA
jgi:hypothetical protein